MANLKHIFKVGQRVKCRNNDFDSLQKYDYGIVTETHEDYIVVNLTEIDVNMYYENGCNIGLVYPIYN